MNIIIAPHCDDEIIGCFEILERKEKCLIIYTENNSVEREIEASILKCYYPDIEQIFSFPKSTFEESDVLYFPDPIYEYHPKHREWGAYGEKLLRMSLNVIFYTTNMNAPYIREVKDFVKKENILTSVYESQKDLWAYDKKYILFSGMCKWII